MTIQQIKLPNHLKTNYLYLGDNLELMKSLEDNSIDLIYSDPPFFSQRNYTTTSKADNIERSFADIFNTLTDYLSFLQIRLIEMKRLLKSTGSIYIHLDWHSVHYVKVIMDSIFGYDNFINNIVWCYTGGGSSKKCFAKKHDDILLYSKSKNYTFNYGEVSIPYAKGTEVSTDEKTQKKYYLKSGNRYYIKRSGKILESWWIDIPNLNHNKLEDRHDYPTEKPRQLLERIIKTSSNPGDIVADFFGGSGVTACESQKLGRKWITIDISENSVNLIKARLLGNNSINEQSYQLPLNSY
jgi:DNA modification methylase